MRRCVCGCVRCLCMKCVCVRACMPSLGLCMSACARRRQVLKISPRLAKVEILAVGAALLREPFAGTVRCARAETSERRESATERKRKGKRLENQKREM